MKLSSKLALLTLCMGLTTSLGWAAESMPEFPSPTPQHTWLQQLVGEWESETEFTMAPGQPAEKSKGMESIRPMGQFWTISEITGMMMNKPFVGNMTLGYSADKQKYIATWIDSMTGQMWNYEGSVDPTGKILTLETQGSCPMNPGKTTRFKETIEIQDQNHKRYTSAMLGEDGQWVTVIRSTAQRLHTK